MPAAAPAPAELLPHELDAVLLEAVHAEDALVTRATATVRAGAPYPAAADGGWPAWLAIELLAQVVAAAAGVREYRPGVRPRLGLLLGVRDWQCARDAFAPGERLELVARESHRDADGMGVYDGEVHAGGERVASGTLTVYLPDDVDDYLQGLEP